MQEVSYTDKAQAQAFGAWLYSNTEVTHINMQAFNNAQLTQRATMLALAVNLDVRLTEYFVQGYMQAAMRK